MKNLYLRNCAFYSRSRLEVVQSFEEQAALKDFVEINQILSPSDEATKKISKKIFELFHETFIRISNKYKRTVKKN